MAKLFNVSSSPHVRSEETTRSIMMDVAIAMLPATAFGVFQFGLHALLVIIATVFACVVSEYVFEKVTKRTVTISDFSAVVTGMILALNCPSEIPLWIPMLGGVFAIVIVKQIYGGLGFTTETRLGRLWLDCRGMQIAGGTDEIMVYIAGRQIAKEYAR